MNDTYEYFKSLPFNSELRKKFLILLEELAEGTSLMEAAAKASISKKELDQMLSAAKTILGGGKKRERAKTAEKAKAGEMVLYADGASRGNPGPASCAAVIEDPSGNQILTRAKRLGRATNNVAEYEGVLLALEAARELGAERVRLRLDSELVVNQLSRRFKVRNPKLKLLHEKAMILLSSFCESSVEYVPRDENKKADGLANAVLDGKS